MAKPMMQFVHKGDFHHIEAFLMNGLKIRPAIRMILDKYGKRGVEALANATPKDSGKTAESWSYEIEEEPNGNMKIVWRNSNLGDGWAPIAILLQYGHATRNGGYVEDHINPAIDSIFHRMADDAWKEVNHERSR